MRVLRNKKNVLPLQPDNEIGIVMQIIAVISIVLLLLMTSVFIFLWTKQKSKQVEIKIKQMEQEKQLIAAQALLDSEMRERTRFACDLHDRLGSMLAATKYNVANIKKTSLLELVDVSLLDKVLELIDESMCEIRRVAYHLMPESLIRHETEINVEF